MDPLQGAEPSLLLGSHLSPSQAHCWFPRFLTPGDTGPSSRQEPLGDRLLPVTPPEPTCGGSGDPEQQHLEGRASGGEPNAPKAAQLHPVQRRRRQTPGGSESRGQTLTLTSDPVVSW